MDYINGFCGAIGNGINRASTYTGGVVNTLVDGKYGFGTLHGKALAVGSYCYESRLALLVTQAGVPFAAFLGGAFCADKVDGEVSKKVADKVVFPVGVAVTTAAIYLANATNCGFHQLTAAATKEMLAKTALSLGDLAAAHTVFNDCSSKKAHGLAGGYLAVRALDTLVNFGAVSQGLVRCNPQPLLSNLNWIASWVR